jgi:hypothetical protein
MEEISLKKSGEWAVLRYPLIEFFPERREAARCERRSLDRDHSFMVVALLFLTPPFPQWRRAMA